MSKGLRFTVADAGWLQGVEADGGGAGVCA